MAPDSHGGPENAGHTVGSANGLDPPPSTLAAQLVGNFSASNRSSRPDESNELVRLVAEIEKVREQPELLKTQEQRLEHNHMLIYVYARVHLVGKWDDPFVNKDKLHSEALSGMQFIPLLIRETPAVLQYRAVEKTFLYRGPEPLWLWILPKILRMLGHRHCTALYPSIQGICEVILHVLRKNGCLWDLAHQMTQYFQANIRGNDQPVSWMRAHLLIACRHI